MKSFYETLEVSPSASNAVIKAAYRCLSQHAHPDKNPGAEDAGQRMLSINRPYAVLSDLEKRNPIAGIRDHQQPARYWQPTWWAKVTSEQPQ